MPLPDDAGSAVPAARKRVLLVDDDPSLRRVFAATLTRAGFDIEVAPDGHVAAQMLADAEYDVVLSDIDMPSMTGIELLRVMRGRHLDVPVLLITGHPAVDTAVEALEQGAMSYLIKPIDPPTLLAAVRRAAQLGALARLKREALTYGGEVRAADRPELEASFARALSSLWMAYQPIIDWPRRRIHAHEALVRSGEPSLPTPGALFDAAERLGSLFALGRQIRAAVGETMRDAPDGCVFVNLHPRELLDENLYDRKAPLTAMAHRVVLEVTERVTLDHIDDVQRSESPTFARARLSHRRRRSGRRLRRSSPALPSSSRTWSSSTAHWSAASMPRADEAQAGRL